MHVFLRFFPSAACKLPNLPASSPTLVGKSVLDFNFAILDEGKPLWWDLEGGDSGAASAFSSFCEGVSRLPFSALNVDAALRTRTLFSEKPSYDMASTVLPEWTRFIADVRGSGNFVGFILPLSSPLAPSLLRCKPELSVACQRPRVPGFNGELKTMGDCRLIDGAASYVLIDMLRSFFTRWNEGTDNPDTHNLHLFYTRPPLGFALVGAPPVCWLVAVEWVGVLFLSTFSRPFFLGSVDHTAAVKSLPSPGFAPPIDLQSAFAKHMWNHDKYNTIFWTATPFNATGVLPAPTAMFTMEQTKSTFLKIRHWNSLRPQDLKNTALAYKSYGMAYMSSTIPPPASLCPAELLFGYCMVAVRMPFVEGVHAQMHELASWDADHPVVAGLADALVWLGLHDLLYVDLRPPNFIIKNPIGRVGVSGANSGNFVGAGGDGELAASSSSSSSSSSRAGNGIASAPCAVRLVDYDDMRIVSGLGDRLRAGAGVEAFRMSFNLTRGEFDFTSGLIDGLESALATRLAAVATSPGAAASAAVPSAAAAASPAASPGAARSAALAAAPSPVVALEASAAAAAAQLGLSGVATLSRAASAAAAFAAVAAVVPASAPEFLYASPSGGRNAEAFSAIAPRGSIASTSTDHDAAGAGAGLAPSPSSDINAGLPEAAAAGRDDSSNSCYARVAGIKRKADGELER